MIKRIFSTIRAAFTPFILLCLSINVVIRPTSVSGMVFGWFILATSTLTLAMEMTMQDLERKRKELEERLNKMLDREDNDDDHPNPR